MVRLDGPCECISQPRAVCTIYTMLDLVIVLGKDRFEKKMDVEYGVSGVHTISNAIKRNDIV